MKRLVLGIFAALAFVLSTGCTVNTPAPDKQTVVFDKGPFSGTTFQECVLPGQQDISGMFDQAFEYPFGQRTWEFADKQARPDAESGVEKVVTKDLTEMTVSGVVTFSLTSDCKVLTQFAKDVGIKLSADTDEGWRKMIGVYVGGPFARALDAASKDFNWRDLFQDPTIRQSWEQRVKELLPSFVKEQGGASFFQGINVTLQQPQPPEDVRKALAASQAAIEENRAQKNKNEKTRTEIEAIKDLVKVLGPEATVLWRAIEKGQVSVIPVPAGTSLNVSPK